MSWNQYDSMTNFCQEIINLPPEGQEIINRLFSSYKITPPSIYTFPRKQLKDNPCDIIIGWSFQSFSLEVLWTEGRGYEWYAKDTISGEMDRSKGYSQIPITPELEEWILRFFPQDIKSALFSLSSLKHLV